ncbi:hypothetical protein HK104_001109 [Borealophlyctis nickersoniae]|nr:hypothetical protein HK104_001109 [Borealophlyctis nickersoniae]
MHSSRPLTTLAVSFAFCCSLFSSANAAELQAFFTEKQPTNGDFAQFDLGAGVYYDTDLNIDGSKYTYTVHQRQRSDDSVQWTAKITETTTSYNPTFFLGNTKSDLYDVGVLQASTDAIVAHRFAYSDGKKRYDISRNGTACPVPVAATGVVDPSSGDFFLVGVCQYRANATSDRNFAFVERIDKNGTSLWRRKITKIWATNVFRPVSVSLDDSAGRLYVSVYRPDPKKASNRIPIIAAFRTTSGAKVYNSRNLRFSPYDQVTSIGGDSGDRTVIVSLISTNNNILLKLDTESSRLVTVWRTNSNKEGDVQIAVGSRAVYTCGTEFESEGPVTVRAVSKESGKELAAVKVPNTGKCEFLSVDDSENVIVGVIDRDMPGQVIGYRLV